MPNVFLPELATIQAVADAMTSLSHAEKMRVAAWLNEYVQQECCCACEASADASAAADGSFEAGIEYDGAELAQDATNAADAEAAAPTYDTFEELYTKIEPKRGAQKAAVAAWWLENKDGKQSWTAFEVNKLIKSIGVKVSSISIVLSNAVKAKDPLVEELGRGGESARSRKAFCLTETGKAYVENLMA